MRCKSSILFYPFQTHSDLYISVKSLSVYLSYLLDPFLKSIPQTGHDDESSFCLKAYYVFLRHTLCQVLHMRSWNRCSKQPDGGSSSITRNWEDEGWERLSDFSTSNWHPNLDLPSSFRAHVLNWVRGSRKKKKKVSQMVEVIVRNILKIQKVFYSY